MEALLFTTSLIGIVILIVYKYLTWHHGIFQKLGLDGPKPNVFLGNFPSVFTGKQPLAFDADEIYRKYKNTHRAVGVFLTRNPQIMILDHELAQEVLVKKFGCFRGNPPANWIYDRNKDKYAARSPFLTSDESWKTKRTEAMGALTQNKLALAYPIWQACAKKLGRYLKEKTANGNAIIETKKLGFCFISNVLGEYVFGIETNSLTKADEPNHFLEMVHKWLDFIVHSLDRYYLLLVAPWLRRFAQNRLYSDDTHHFFSQLTKDALELREKGQKRVDFLNYMRQLQEKRNISHDDIVGHILTTLIDGIESTAMILFHTIFYLTHHPEYQDKLRKEIADNLEGDGFVSYDSLRSLPYLDQCVNETIRLIASTPLMTRICTEATELDIGDGKIIPIPVGQGIIIPVFCYQHDPTYFPQPYEYNPDRFNNEAHLELIKKGIFMPFGCGPRICIGMHLAMLEVKTCLVEIFKSYRVKCCEKTILETPPASPTFIQGIDGEFWLEYERL